MIVPSHLSPYLSIYNLWELYCPYIIFHLWVTLPVTNPGVVRKTRAGCARDPFTLHNFVLAIGSKTDTSPVFLLDTSSCFQINNIYGSEGG